MIILTLVDGYEEIFETFHLLKPCRSTTRYHSVLDIKRVYSPHPLLLGIRNYCLLYFSLFYCCFANFCMDWALSTCISEEILHLQLLEALSIVA